MKQYIILALLCNITAYAAACTDTLTALPTATFETGANVRALDWQQIGFSYYLATGSDTASGPEVRVFSFDPTTSALTPLPTATFEYGDTIESVAWQQIGSSYYLATGGRLIPGPEVNVFIFNPNLDTLTYLPTATFEYNAFVWSVAWQQIGSSYYLATSGDPVSGPEIRIFNFDATSAVLQQLPTATFEYNGNAFSVAWQQIGTSYYLAVGGDTAGANIQVLQFNPAINTLSGLPTATFDNGSTATNVAWLAANSSYYLAFGGSSGIATALLFDPIANRLSSLPSGTFNYGAFINDISWHTINSSHYLAIGGAPSNNVMVQVVQFDPASGLFSLLPSATFNTTLNVFSVAWQQIGTSAYLAAGNAPVPNGPELRVLQFNACLTNPTPTPTPTPTPSSETNDFTQALIAKYYTRVIATS